jgi:hypothetical protein
MNHMKKYDPEDIEYLMIHKQFHELYPEEKEFVLQHVEGVEEYESMRKMLLELKNSSVQDDWLTPDASLKKALMAEFAKERKGRFSIWLNSLFAMPERPFYRQTGVQWSFGLVVIALGTFIFLQQSTDVKVLAENNVTSQEATKSEDGQSNPAQPNSANQPIPSKPEVDLSGMDKLPQAPVVLAQVQPVTQDVPQEEAVPKVQNYKSVALEESVAESDAADVAMAPPAPEIKELELNKNVVINGTATTLSAGASTTSQSTKFIENDTIFISSAESTQMTNYADLLDITFTAR